MSAKFHAGELAVQERTGVRTEAARIGKSLKSVIPPVAAEFLRERRFIVLGSLDADGRVWTSLLTGAPGFLTAPDEHTLRIAAQPAPGDPLSENLHRNPQAGTLTMDLAHRRRMRLNGDATITPDGIEIQAREVMALCPKYIQARAPEADAGGASDSSLPQRSQRLTESQQRRLAAADTFFLASFHSEGGVDVSHRGGNPGFVRVLHPTTLAWPDYRGNNMFQTLGNLELNPNAGLLLIDFATGATLQLTGKCKVIWDADRVAQSPGAQRVMEFHVEEVLERTSATGLRWRLLDYSPFNP
ncbi:MAG: pyridoxamine 5'-phosphate oxidase family protein [Terriglobales bacterium]